MQGRMEDLFVTVILACASTAATCAAIAINTYDGYSVRARMGSTVLATALWAAAGAASYTLAPLMVAPSWNIFAAVLERGGRAGPLLLVLAHGVVLSAIYIALEAPDTPPVTIGLTMQATLLLMVLVIGGIEHLVPGLKTEEARLARLEAMLPSSWKASSYYTLRSSPCVSSSAHTIVGGGVLCQHGRRSLADNRVRVAHREHVRGLDVQRLQAVARLRRHRRLHRRRTCDMARRGRRLKGSDLPTARLRRPLQLRCRFRR